jgi:hypothetical protein
VVVLEVLEALTRCWLVAVLGLAWVWSLLAVCAMATPMVMQQAIAIAAERCVRFILAP